MAVIPGFALSFYGMGLLQIIGSPMSVEVLVFDTVIAILAITFLTKPTHEIIKVLETIAGYKKGQPISKS